MKGYRVGWQCFATEQEAQDYQLSQVIPVITSDGSLKHPVREKSGVWKYGSQTIKPSYPACDIEQEIADGAKIAGAIVLLMITAYGIRFITDYIKTSFYYRSNDE